MSAPRVVLVHGLCRTSRSMRQMGEALKHAGFVVSNIDYDSRSAKIEALAESAIGEALGDNLDYVHFVTHSLGGILVRWYGARHPEAKIGRVVMLGPPNRGSEVVDRLKAWWLFKALNGPAGQQLGTSTDSIPNCLSSPQFQVGVIAGCRSINLINSCWIEGPDDGKVSVEKTKLDGMLDHIVLRTCHPFMMKNREVIRQTIAFLTSGSFDKSSAKLVRPSRASKPVMNS